MSLKILQKLIELVVEDELNEFNAMSSGAVVGYTGPLGMDTKPGHKILWSNPKRKNRKVSEILQKSFPNQYEDPYVDQGMMGTDSGPKRLPAQMFPDKVHASSQDTVRRGRTVSDTLREKEPPVEENVLDAQGHKYVGKNYRLGSETYLQKDEPQKKRETAIIKAVNKNINKGKWGKKNTLKDPPMMGISLGKK